jgi:TPP-dependent 2-oxoacid decarboxylase
MPGKTTQTSSAIMHHTLSNGECDLSQRMTEPVVCASAVMTPQNVVYEIERQYREVEIDRGTKEISSDTRPQNLRGSLTASARFQETCAP